MRVLFASTSGSGHFTPLIPFIDACTARGDDVLVVGPVALEPVLAARPEVYRLTKQPAAADVGRMKERLLTLAPQDAVRAMVGEVFGGLYPAAILPDLDEVCRTWRPDLVLHETCEFGSVVAAERYGIAHARVAITSASFAGSTDDLLPAVFAPYDASLGDRLAASPYLTRFPASVDPSPYQDTRRYHDTPVLESPPDSGIGVGDPLVYLTLGTEAGAMPGAPALYRAFLDALSDLPVRVLLTVGRTADVSAIGPIPENARVEAWVPQAQVLESAAVVLCHGGSGTVFGALAAGVPVVCVPLFADQHANAGLVAESGAGRAVEPSAGATRTGSLGPDAVSGIRTAVELALEKPSYREAARRLADEMRAEPAPGDLIGAFEGGPATRHR